MSKAQIREVIVICLLLVLPVIHAHSQRVPDSLRTKLEQSKRSEQPKILNQIAEALMVDFPLDAKSYAEQALELGKEYGNDTEIISAYLNIGDCYFYLDDYDQAGIYYDNAMHLSMNSGNQKLLAASYYYKAVNFDYLNAFEKAINNYAIAIKIYDSIQMPEMVSDLSYNLGTLLNKQGNYYEAYRYFEKSLLITDSLGMDESSAETLNTIGVLYYDWGDYEKAVDYYNRSLKIMQSNGNKAGIASVLNNMGILYYDWGNLDEALRYYQESLDLEKERNDATGIATSFNNIGIIYADRKKYDKALEYYEKSLAMNEELQDKSGIATALNNIGELYSETGQHNLAIIMLERSLKLEKEIGDRYGIAIAYGTLSELYQKSGELKISKQYNDSCYRLSMSINNPETIQAALENYYKISEAEGNDRQALMYYKKYTGLKDSLFNQSLHKQLSEVRSKYELEQKEGEIELLNSKNRLHELDLENKQIVVKRQRIIVALSLTGFVAILVVLLILFRQIRQKKKAYFLLDEQNKEILQGREELLKAIEKAEESDRLKSVFLANMSHELRTPLNGILGFTGILRAEITDPEHRDMADIIHASGNRLLDTLNSIIDLSIIESNRMEVEYSNIPLYDFINERVALFQMSAAKKNIQLNVEVKDHNIIIFSDRSVLTNLLNNLVDNAIKYTHEGSVNVEAGIQIREGSSWMVLKVIDTGIGIQEEKLKDIFERFRQGSEGHDRQFEGAGLGLTICKKYIEILDGEIKVESKYGEGSKFEVAFPVKTTSRSVLGQNQQNEKEATSLKSTTGKTPDVLIVENDDTNLAHLKYSLHNDCNIETAKSGIEAVEKAGLQKFDVILMDINLGASMNGMEAAQAIRKIKGYANTPIVAVTANAMKGHKEEFLSNGCSHYISKPFSSQEIKKLVFDVIKNSE